MPESEKEMDGLSLLAHAIELRKRFVISFLALFVGFAVSYFFAPDIYSFLARPLAEAAPEASSHRLIYTGLAEVFVSYLKLSLWGGLVLAFPVIASQLWLFVAPGLYRTEKGSFLFILLASPVLFFLGGALAYKLVFPMAWKFFLSFEELAPMAGGLPIQMEARVSEYLSLSMTLIFAFGLAFQLPVLLALLVRIGALTSVQIARFRRFAVVFIFVFAAVTTPPDVISQIALAVPMLLLYEISIILARGIEKRRGRQEQDSLL